MSKKMLKRSLALSALMAFVITGSAMAAEYEGQNYTATRESGSIHGTVFGLSGTESELTEATTFKNCNFTGNTGISKTGEAYGGAIYTVHDLTVDGCTFSENIIKSTNGKIAHGGAISHGGGMLVVNNSTFDGNRALTESKTTDNYGAAIFSSGGTGVEITGSTF